MAVNAQAAALTEAHRAAQARRAAVVGFAVQRLWATTFDPENIIESAQRWITATLPIILRANAQSAALARTYMSTFRTLELDRLEPFTPEPIPLLESDRVQTSLWVTGPKALEKKLVKISGLDVEPALERALISEAVEEAGAQAAGSAMRHTTNGARDQIKDTVRKDRRALGWIRVTDADPCYFCAMLASRAIGGDGKLAVLYSEQSFAASDSFFTGDGKAKAHDNCACSLQPIYSSKDKGLQAAEAWSAMWAESTTGKSGSAAILAFRQAYEGRKVAA